jgi:hypothetical protein
MNSRIDVERAAERGNEFCKIAGGQSRVREDISVPFPIARGVYLWTGGSSRRTNRQSWPERPPFSLATSETVRS